jgi:flagellar hook-basal body complex protein FliE
VSEPATNGYISRGNMTVVLSAAGLIMLAFGSFITFQNNATDRRLQEVREDLKDLAKLSLKKEEHEEFKLRIDKDITRMEKGVVPRSEHDAKWKSTDDFAQLLSNRVNEVRNNLASITTPQSQFTRMESDISELRKQHSALLEALAKRP